MRWIPLFLALVLCALVASSVTQASTLTRDRDPVVLRGSDVPRIPGLAPSSVVAFRFDTAWVQIPVQIDERDTETSLVLFQDGHRCGERLQDEGVHAEPRT